MRYRLDTQDIRRFHTKWTTDGTGCHIWTGALFQSTGYGIFNVKAEDGRWRPTVAHRVAKRIADGELSDALVIDHLCRNRQCVNPQHLELVTNRTNILRGAGPSARQAAQTSCQHGHPFDTANTYTKPDTNKRECRTCMQARDRRRSTGPPSPEAQRAFYASERLCKAGHLLDAATTYWLRPGTWQCRACNRDRAKRSRAKT